MCDKLLNGRELLLRGYTIEDNVSFLLLSLIIYERTVTADSLLFMYFKKDGTESEGVFDGNSVEIASVLSGAVGWRPEMQFHAASCSSLWRSLHRLLRK